MGPIARRALLPLASVLAPLAGPAAADYPTRPVELVVPFAAGGGTDMMARAFAEAAKSHLPQPVVVVNKPGASGAIDMGEVVKAEPDGYKMGLVTVELVIFPLLNKAQCQQARAVSADAPHEAGGPRDDRVREGCRRAGPDGGRAGGVRPRAGVRDPRGRPPRHAGTPGRTCGPTAARSRC